jgi:hypothetical protein
MGHFREEDFRSFMLSNTGGDIRLSGKLRFNGDEVGALGDKHLSRDLHGDQVGGRAAFSSARVRRPMCT